MFFAKKKKKSVEENEQDLRITTIPSDFYAGAEPTIKFKKVEKTVDLNKEQFLTKKEAVIHQQKTAKGGEKKLHPANLFTSRKFILLTSLGLFVIFVAGASAYYWYSASRPATGSVPTATTNQTSAVGYTTDSSASTSSVSSVTSTSTSSNSSDQLSKENIIFPSLLLGYGLDYDNDGLSDKEETLFGTELAINDTDNDGYTDGHEVYYLYNPAGKEPKKLINSSFFKQYINPTFGYSLYYPASWAIGNIDSNYSDILFTALSGESVEVKVVSSAGLNFDNWFSANATGEKYSLLKDFTSVYNQAGKMRNDELVYYFLDGQQVYVIVYHATNDNLVNYRAIIGMIARSFKSKDNNFVKLWAQEDSSTGLSASSTMPSVTSTITVTATTTSATASASASSTAATSTSL
ncbi:MAG: hypothetical protein COU31_03825 [Candidatus Magasanikbacteria bacterium CG10_big_fil_rev_8_21_14_0_10_40_10]|uniref:Bacterial repeat domain-containing protein n=1 Tax=Candidatus Magasanikbacteria bacterium CG10_big_fil_rev_8_21_14_0_10_40_10 TaxID=1974648 RepID=A0A2M6W394_9BACT|nr:MAG: hypothetical protein COU31_03825 [Candidatus Magasanikbacteria bacterium CG10_big_fil_rev_8_21_14_0_10_40_10]